MRTPTAITAPIPCSLAWRPLVLFDVSLWGAVGEKRNPWEKTPFFFFTRHYCVARQKHFSLPKDIPNLPDCRNTLQGLTWLESHWQWVFHREIINTQNASTLKRGEAKRIEVLYWGKQHQTGTWKAIRFCLLEKPQGEAGCCCSSWKVLWMGYQAVTPLDLGRPNWERKLNQSWKDSGCI